MYRGSSQISDSQQEKFALEKTSFHSAKWWGLLFRALRLHGLNFGTFLVPLHCGGFFFFSFLSFPFYSTRNKRYCREWNDEKHHQVLIDTTSAYFTNCTKAALIGVESSYELYNWIVAFLEGRGPTCSALFREIIVSPLNYLKNSSRRSRATVVSFFQSLIKIRWLSFARLKKLDESHNILFPIKIASNTAWGLYFGSHAFKRTVV